MEWDEEYFRRQLQAMRDKSIMAPPAWKEMAQAERLPTKAPPPLSQALAAARQSSWLAEQPAGFCDALLKLASFRRFDKNQIITRLDDEGSSLHFLLHGAVEMLVPWSAQDILPVHIVSPLEWFGEYGAITGKSNFAEYRARTPCSAVAISHASLVLLKAQEPGFHEAIIGLLATAMRTHLEWAAALTGNDAGNRIRSRLFHLAGAAKQMPGENGIVVPLSQEEIAIVTSVSRATVSKVLKQLQDEGIIRLGYRKIVVLERDELITDNGRQD